MTILATYHGVLEKNRVVRLRQDLSLPEGTEVIVVVAQPLSIKEQERRLTALSPEEWRRPFDEFADVVAQEKADVDVADVSDEELLTLVHETRQEST